MARSKPYTPQPEANRIEFEQTALVHLNALYSMALKLTKNAEDAEDVTQECLMRAYRFWHHYEAGTNCKAWLFRILKNTFINSYRRKKRAPEKTDFGAIEGVMESLIEEGDSSPKLSPEDALFNTLLEKDIGKAFEKLPPEYREALALSLVEGFAYKEISEILDVPIGTVMSRIHRGRKLLQDTLATYAEETAPGTGRVVSLTDRTRKMA